MSLSSTYQHIGVVLQRAPIETMGVAWVPMQTGAFGRAPCEITTQC